MTSRRMHGPQKQDSDANISETYLTAASLYDDQDNIQLSLASCQMLIGDTFVKITVQ